MQMPARQPRQSGSMHMVNASQKIQALVPALNYTLGLLQEGYNTADLAKEQAAMTEINILFNQISSYVDHLDPSKGKQYETRLKSLAGDLNQLQADMKRQNISGIHRDFTLLSSDIEALRKLA